MVFRSNLEAPVKIFEMADRVDDKTACNTLSPSQANWILGLQVLVIAYNTGILILGFYNVYQHFKYVEKHRTLPVFLFYLMSMLTLVSLIFGATLSQETEPNSVVMDSVGYLFAMFGIMCVGWTQTACMLELVLKLRFVVS